MDDHDWLAEQFEANRGRLRAVAYRMLGSPSEADDAVQDAWLNVSRSGAKNVDNLGGWLTTVVARVCLDMLRSRKSRREEPLDERPVMARPGGADPEQAAVMADSVGMALLVVLDTLAPAERLAFVLHDMFAVPFEEIATIVGRSPAAARQLASRGRRRVQGAGTPGADHARQRAVVDAFLAASRDGDFEALLAVLDPDVVLRTDRTAVESAAARRSHGAPEMAPEVRGAAVVAGTFSGRAQVVRPALVNGAPGAAFAPGGRPRFVFAFTVADGRVSEIEIISDPDRLRGLDLVILDD